MKPSTALRTHRDSILRIVEAHQTCNPRVFGSVIHGTDTHESDLDLLVDPMPDTTLLNLASLQIALEQLLGVRVDVVTPNGLRSKYRDEIIANAQPI